MKKRVLTDGTDIEILKDPIHLMVRTKVPSKWILIDQETGQVYQGSNRLDKYGPWIRLNVDDNVVSEDIVNRLYAIIESASAVEKKVI